MKLRASGVACLWLAVAAGLWACSAGGRIAGSDGGVVVAGGNGGGTIDGSIRSDVGVGGIGGPAGSGAAGSNAVGGTGGTSSGSGSAGAPARVMSAPVNSIKGPTVTFDEYPIPKVSAAMSSSPGGISSGPDGRVWFLHQNTGPSANGAITVNGASIAEYKTSVTNIGPVAINPGPDGNVWYTKQQGIGKMLPSGGYTEYGAPQGAQTGGIIKGPDGNMWFTEPIANRIGTITMSGQAKDFPVPGTGKDPGDITLGPDGNLWFAETTGNNIGRITPTGAVTEYPIPTPASFPNAITAGPDGNVWFVEHDAHNIGRVTPTGQITEFGIPSGGRPYAITLGSDGNLWFSEPGSFNAIGRCTPTGGISEYPIPTPNTEVAGITSGPDKNIWFAERDANKIGRLSNLTGGGNVASATGDFGTTLTTSGKCTVDRDCIASGKACGGDLCSHKAATPVCVLSISGDPGWCNTAADCWCAAKNATCDAATHSCSVTSN
jgi:streptogramin lyase